MNFLLCKKISPYLGLIAFFYAFFLLNSFITSNKEVAEIFVLSLGVCIAFVSILTYRRTEKLKVTLGIVYEITNSLLSRNGVDILRLIKSDNNNETGEFLASNYLKRSKSLKTLNKKELHRIEHARGLCAYLNLLEILSVGISEKIYDESTCKKAFYNKVVEGWKGAKTFITSIRGKTEHTLYQEFEKLAMKWEKNPLKKTSR